MTSFPSFSKPLTRADYDKVISNLTDYFTKQNLPDPRSLAAIVVNLRDQGLTDAQIQKQIDQHLATVKAKADAKAAEVAKLQAAQKPLLDKLSAAKSAKQAIIDAQRAEREKAVKEFIAGKPSNEMLADPRDPSKKVTRAEYDAIIAKMQAQGKDTRQTSGTQNVEALRAQIAAQKAGNANPVVIDVNKSFVLLSNGQLIERSKFTGTIPAELLAKANTAEQFPKSFNSQQAQIDAKNGIKPDVSSSSNAKSQMPFDPLKAITDAANATTSTVTDLLNQAGKTITDAVTSITNPPKQETPQQTPSTTPNTPPKQDAPFDPLKMLTDAANATIKTITDLAGGAAKTITDATQAAGKAAADAAAAVTPPPKQTAQPENKPDASNTEKVPTTPSTPTGGDATHGDPIPESEKPKSILTKAKDFAEKNSIAIVASVAAVSFLSALAFTMPQARKAVMEK